ncbi:hypothetical protein KAJ89_04350 [Candidatus Parcubacteria bacterium]|nr:hypothetical protein [Candidatus Parcubacteria bacterium]
MLVTKCNIPDISDLKLNATGCFIAGLLTGKYKNIDPKMEKYITVLVRLVDKAIYEYKMTREAVLDEVKENGLSYKQIIKRGKGQLLHTTVIINHLENCINAIARCNKILKRITNKHTSSSEIQKVRNSIEHMDQRIADEESGPASLNISEDSLAIEIVGNGNILKVEIEELEKEIRYLYNDIIKI